MRRRLAHALARFAWWWERTARPTFVVSRYWVMVRFRESDTSYAVRRATREGRDDDED